MSNYQTEQEIWNELRSASPFGRLDAIEALVTAVGYEPKEAERIVDEWIADLEPNPDAAREYNGGDTPPI